jgi:LysM repeat protein
VYTVRSGDYLTSIAQRYNTTVQAIMEANGLTSTRLFVGQKLIIPVGPATPTATATD